MFRKKFDNDVKRVNRRVISYLKSTSEENIHDVRTAIRRLEATSNILSKGIRRGKLSKYLDQCKDFFKINTKLRDIDIIRAKLSEYPEMRAQKQVFALLKDRREHLLLRSTKVAAKIKNNESKLDTRRLSEAKLRKRFDKIVSKQDRKIQSLLPLVLGDSKNIEELHLLRKTSKRLRYMLEVDSTWEGFSALIDLLRKWQDLLGKIHDSDITIDYLVSLKRSKSVADVLANVRNVRSQEYKEFVSLFRNGHYAGALHSPEKVFPLL